MQNEINQFFNDIFPQTLGMTYPVSILGLSLLAPGLIVLGLAALVSYFKPRWRGYWDAV